MRKWRGIASALFLSIATIGAVSTVAATPSRAADVGFGIVVRDHDNDRYRDRYWERRHREAEWRREQWRREHYWRERERRWAWREHQRHERWEPDHRDW